MASAVNAACCALVATAFWTSLGYALGRHVLPRPVAVGAAPALGWAVQSAAVLPIFFLIGFSPMTVVGVGVVCAIIAAASFLARPIPGPSTDLPAIPAWTYIAAAILALAPTVAILPKFGPDTVYLADPIFDHSKIAIVDAMMRQGLPPVNPVFGEFGTPGRLAYYFLWHFSAAELALPLRISGWEADIGLTWFTAFASLTLMMGLAVWLAKKSGAAIFVVLLASTASLRATFNWLFGSYDLTPFLSSPTGFAGWLFQSAWVPQHLMSAACVVLAMLLLARFARRQSAALLLTLALIVAAAFESSTYVGGVTFAIAALGAAPLLLLGVDRARRLHFVIGLMIAAVLVAGLISPLILDQLATVAVRGDHAPIVVHHFEVLGDMFPQPLRRLLDLPAYWLVLLPIELPATYAAGAIALVVMLRGAVPGPERLAVAAFACLAAAGLIASWLLVSTLGDNNDLGLRAVLPAAMILIVSAVAGMMLAGRRPWVIAIALGGLTLSLPDTVNMIRSNVNGSPKASGQTFAKAPELWAAVRRYASPTSRVANNPLFLQDLTPWPVNISWALLANRSSCFAGRELALPFAPVPADRREAINAQFVRVFGGAGTSEDVHEMATRFACNVVVVVPQDGAWTNDPFAHSPDYRLAEGRNGQWRIYVSVSTAR